MKHLKSFALSLVLMVLSLALYAQPGITRETILTPSINRALSAPDFSNTPNIVRLPIVDYYSDNIPIVEVTIEGQTYHFVFDTGAEYTIFNARYIDQSQGGKITSVGIAERANGAESLLGIVKASNFSLGGLEAKTLYMASMLAERFDIIESMPINFGAYYITTDCKVNGKRLRLLIDTGAFSCLLPYKKGLKHNRRDVIPDEERIFVLGKQKFSNISACLSYNAGRQGYYDGLLGNNLLQLQPILISIKSRQLLLLKSH